MKKTINKAKNIVKDKTSPLESGLSRSKFNVIGENHGNYRGETGEAARNKEITFCKEQIGDSSEYLVENEFIDKETGSSADPWYLRMLQRINDIELFIRNIRNNDYQSLEESLNNMIEDKSLNFAVEEVQRPIEDLRLTIGLLKLENPDVLDKIRNPIETIKKICQEQPTNLSDDYSTKPYVDQVNMIRKERSKYMHQAAQKSYKEQGVWKIGEDHVRDIRNEFKEIDYNLKERIDNT
jgi:hypothetical protein